MAMKTLIQRVVPLASLAACLAAGGFVFQPGHIVNAASPSPESAQVFQSAQVSQMQSALTALQTRLSAVENTNAKLQSAVQRQQVTINALQKKTAPITIATDTERADGTQSTEMFFTRVNVHIIDGSGHTNDNTNNGGKLLGLGNLIVGYNETRGSSQDNRTGSHNLIVGIRANYASYGGVVFGYNNTIANSGHYAAVTGGNSNTASGAQASVSGGYLNTASYYATSVSGGSFSTASGYESSVCGGQGNVASGAQTSVSGGYANRASGQYTSISGGEANTASGNTSSVSGGYANTASGDYNSISGGEHNTASTAGSSVSGGLYNTASNYCASVSAGYFNTASGQYGSVSGGQENTASGYDCAVSGGHNNLAGDGGNSNNIAASVSGGSYIINNGTNGWSAGGSYSSSAPGPGVFHAP